MIASPGPPHLAGALCRAALALLLASAFGDASGAANAAAVETAVTFPLTVRPGQRYLEDANGVPFLIQGDAAWSLIAQLTREDVDRYLYVAHQSLNLLLKRHFEGFRPDVVVFYDGVNDVLEKCPYQLGPYSHSREIQIRTALHEFGSGNLDSFLLTVLPIRNLLEYVGAKLRYRLVGNSSLYDCHKNPGKAEQIARVLLSDWLVVKDLVESCGGTFVPILQPVIYFSDTKTDHLELSEELKWQYETVYPLIIELMNREFPELAGNFVDLRDALDRDEYLYFDFCHLSPDGNQLVAERISQSVAVQTGKVVAAQKKDYKE